MAPKKYRRQIPKGFSDEMNQAIAKRVRDLRKKIGMTSSDLARRVKLTPTQMSRLERGLQGFRCGTLTRVSTALGVSPAWFFADPASDAEVKATMARLRASVHRAFRDTEFVRLVHMVADLHATDVKTYRNVQRAIEALVKIR